MGSVYWACADLLLENTMTVARALPGKQANFGGCEGLQAFVSSVPLPLQSEFNVHARAKWHRVAELPGRSARSDVVPCSLVQSGRRKCNPKNLKSRGFTQRTVVKAQICAEMS